MNNWPCVEPVISSSERRTTVNYSDQTGKTLRCVGVFFYNHEHQQPYMAVITDAGLGPEGEGVMFSFVAIKRVYSCADNLCKSQHVLFVLCFPAECFHWSNVD